MYRYLDAAILRAPAWQADCQRLPWPDLTSRQAGPVSWRSWIEQIGQVPEFSEAVRVASPHLAGRISQILAGRHLPEPALRRVVHSTMRYLLRASSRATPFGLFAGAAAVRIGSAAESRVGTAHRAEARVDAAWAARLAEELEVADEVRPSLHVLANNLLVERAGYLVLDHRSRGSAGGPPEHVRIKATAPIQATLAAARQRILVVDLEQRLMGRFPDISRERIASLIAGLLRQGFLVSNLRSPMTTRDPLAAIVARLNADDRTQSAHVAALRENLGMITTGLARHNSARSPEAARRERATVRSLMTSVCPDHPPALAVDLRLDWDLTIPQEVAAEAASAAGALTRLARRPTLSSAWAAWHRRFLDRYGPAAVVPVTEVVDPCAGIGYPAGYLGTPPAAAAPPTDRDKALLNLAQRAGMRGDREVALDEAMIAVLANSSLSESVQPSAEITVRIHADNLDDLNQGRFTLHITGVSRSAGTTTGRFLALLDTPDRDRMTAFFGALPAAHRGAMLAHLSSSPLYVNAENVARAPQAAGLSDSAGRVHRARTRSDSAGRPCRHG